MAKYIVKFRRYGTGIDPTAVLIPKPWRLGQLKKKVDGSAMRKIKKFSCPVQLEQ